MFFVYILRSLKDNSFYIGQTGDLKKRLAFHNGGLSRYTHNKRPWKVVYFEKFTTRSEARVRENLLKSYKGGEAFKKLLASSSTGVSRHGGTG